MKRLSTFLSSASIICDIVLDYCHNYTCDLVLLNGFIISTSTHQFLIYLLVFLCRAHAVRRSCHTGPESMPQCGCVAPLTQAPSAQVCSAPGFAGSHGNRRDEWTGWTPGHGRHRWWTGGRNSTVSIHFWTTWLPFWSLTHFNTLPSNSWIISCCCSRGMDSKAFWMTRQPYICSARCCTLERSWNRRSNYTFTLG